VASNALFASNLVSQVMEPVLPGRFAVMTVGGSDESTQLYAFPLADGASAHPGDGAVGMAVSLPRVQRQAECFTVDVPAGPLSVLALQTTPHFDPQTAWLANRPRLDWVFPAQPQVGAPLQIIGRCLVRADRYVTTDPRQPVSHGGLLTPADAGFRTRAVLRPAGGDAYMPLTVTKASAYEAHLTLPAEIAPGAWELYLHNGLGGAAGWSEPICLEVAAAAPWPTQVFAIESYRAQGGKDDDAFTRALADLTANGGGILALAARTYYLGKTLVLPPRTILRGAGPDRTRLALPHGGGPADGSGRAPFVAVTGDRDFVVEDLNIHGVYAPLLICAPSFNPSTKAEAATGALAIGLTDRRASNVVVRRCRLEQHPFKQSMRRKDFDQSDWMKGFGQRGWAAMGDHWACVSFKGDGLEVSDCEILGGGHAVDLNRSSQVRLLRNILKGGFFSMAVHGFTRLTWPASGGAKIAGNEMRQVIIADNDLSARSEFVRNLLSFNFGGDQLYLARNHFHDYPPNCDSEALMTHLWNARWTEPTVRMTSPTTAEIIDPTGEVANEILDGAWLDIVEGHGMGQIRQIIRRTGQEIEFDRPWRVAPNERSKVVFTAPALFRHLTVVDNRLSTEAINIILWGSNYDAVVDGNQVADGPGITVWSIRLAAKQKVWGVASFTLVCNNLMERGYSSPTRPEDCLDSAMGFFIRCSKSHDCTALGYDLLGLIVRDNHATNNTGMAIRTTFSEKLPDGRVRRWPVQYAGLVLEHNLVTDSVVGFAIEEGTAVAERANTCERVTFPMSRVAISHLFPD
jgi:hypothetical protein